MKQESRAELRKVIDELTIQNGALHDSLLVAHCERDEARAGRAAEERRAIEQAEKSVKDHAAQVSAIMADHALEKARHEADRAILQAERDHARSILKALILEIKRIFPDADVTPWLNALLVGGLVGSVIGLFSYLRRAPDGKKGEGWFPRPPQAPTDYAKVAENLAKVVAP